jgi:hypothetical protein
VDFQEPDTDLKGAIKDLEATPKELTLVTAILIKHQFVRTLDIMPYVRLFFQHTSWIASLTVVLCSTAYAGRQGDGELVS